ncbi:hypothetical protein Tco_1495146, partial [Tanacetum coccineum]
MSKGNGTREKKPTWNNVQRVNKQNQFVPLVVQTRTGNNPVNTAKASSTNNFSIARQNVNRQTILTSTALKVNTVKPIMNGVRPANVFHKTHSPSSTPFKRTTILRINFTNQKVYTATVKEVSIVGGKWDTADYPHRALKNKGIVDSVCSRHMTGNKAYLAEFQDFNGGPIAFGGSKGYITGKGKPKGKPSVQRDPLFDELPEDTVDHMETENAQDEGRIRDIVDEDKEIEENVLSTEDVLSTDKDKVSTDKEKVSIDRPIVSTDGSKVSIDRHIEGTDEQVEGTEEHIEGTKEQIESTDGQIKDDETIAKVLLNMSQAKAVSREKEKGIELKDIEEADRPRPTSTRSLLTLKLLPKIDPKDKGKKKIEEED